MSRIKIPPVVIGSVSGSGTRDVTEMLIRLGYHMGTDNNSQHDSLWFRFLLKRPDWYLQSYRRADGEIEKGLDLLSRIMTGPYVPGRADMVFISRAVREQGGRGVKRLMKLLKPRCLDYAHFAGWGWKEASSHVFLDTLYRQFPGVKYIHMIRHGLDMSYTEKLSQLRDWAFLYDVALPTSHRERPLSLLDFWVKANERVLDIGRRIGSDQFYLLNYDRMCESPRDEVRKLVAFLGVDVSDERIDSLSEIPHIPPSKNRYRNHDLGIFRPRDLEAVRKIGFPVEI